MVDGQKDHGFDKLGLNGRAPHGNNGFTGENRGAFRHGPHVTFEFEVAQVVDKFRPEDFFAFQIGQIFFGKVQVIQVIYHLLYPGHNGKPAAVGHRAVEHIKIDDGIAIPSGQVTVGHGDFVKVGEHGEVDRIASLFERFHCFFHPFHSGRGKTWPF